MIYSFQGESGGPTLALDENGGRYWFHAEDRRYRHTPKGSGEHRIVVPETEAAGSALFAAFQFAREKWEAEDPQRAKRTTWTRPPHLREMDPKPIDDAAEAGVPSAYGWYLQAKGDNRYLSGVNPDVWSPRIDQALRFGHDKAFALAARNGDAEARAFTPPAAPSPGPPLPPMGAPAQSTDLWYVQGQDGHYLHAFEHNEDGTPNEEPSHDDAKGWSPNRDDALLMGRDQAQRVAARRSDLVAMRVDGPEPVPGRPAAPVLTVAQPGWPPTPGQPDTRTSPLSPEADTSVSGWGEGHAGEP
jgi:hypothetical protein